jgi:hypothetical protein
VYYGAGYMELTEVFKTGGIVAAVNLLIWGVVGMGWCVEGAGLVLSSAWTECIVLSPGCVRVCSNEPGWRCRGWQRYMMAMFQC